MKGISVFAAILGFAAGVSAEAHGGGLNVEGCHNDRRRGTYHCHRGASSSPAPVPQRSYPAPSPAPRATAITAPPPSAPLPLLLTVPSHPAPTPTGRAPIVGRAVVLDGDTIQIDSQRIRLWGVDAFEAAQQCKWPNGSQCVRRTRHARVDGAGFWPRRHMFVS